MKKMNFTVVALSALLVLGSCGTSQRQVQLLVQVLVQPWVQSLVVC